MTLLAGICLSSVAYLLLRGRNQAHHSQQECVPAHDRELRIELARLKCELAIKVAELAALKAQKAAPEGVDRELDRLILQDALQREARAKAAFGALLRRQGLDENQIQSLVDIIDGQPEPEPQSRQ